jgi:hypothetical protein
MKEAGINCMAAWRDDVQLFAERYRDRLLAEARG